MSHDETDTSIQPHSDRRHEGMSNRDFMREIDAIRAELNRRKDERHESNTKVHQLFGEVSMRLDQHDDEIKVIREQGERTNATLVEIKNILAGSFGQEGLAARIKAVEATVADHEWKIRVMWGVGLTLAAPLGTAMGAAVVWLLVHGSKGTP